MTNQNAIDIFDLINSGDIAAPVRQLSQDDKEAMAHEGTVFTVTDIAIAEDPEWGTQWQVTAEAGTDTFTFRMKCTEARDPFMQQLAELVVKQPVGNLRLNSYATRKGNAYIALEPNR